MPSSGGSYGTVTVGTSAVLVITGAVGREEVTIQNVHASNILYLGTDSSVATTTGLKLLAGESMTVRSGGPIYGIASGASTDVRYLSLT